MVMNGRWLRFFEWAGCATALAGSLLLALHATFSGWGFVVYLISNASWTAFAILSRTWGIFVMQVGFTATSLVGVWRWMI